MTGSYCVLQRRVQNDIDRLETDLLFERTKYENCKRNGNRYCEFNMISLLKIQLKHAKEDERKFAEECRKE